MSELLAVLTGFPTVVFTVLMGVSLVYWLFVVLGAIDLDSFGGGHADADGLLEGAAKGVAEGAAEAAAHGATDGLADGAADGLAEGAVKGVAEGAVKGAAEGAVKGVAGGLKGAVHQAGGDAMDQAGAMALGPFTLRFGKAPVTVIASVFVVLAWLMTALATYNAGALLAAAPMPRWLFGSLALAASSFVSLVVTSFVVRPLSPVFTTQTGKSRRDLVGRVCVVTTGHVAARFGQAALDEGGDALLLQVRCEDGDALKRGDRALILGWDEGQGGFLVEPMDALEKPPKRLSGSRRAHAEPDGARDAPGEAEETEGAPPGDARARRG